MAEWQWKIVGVEPRETPGAMERGLEDEGVVAAESAGDAIAQLLQHGLFWDNLDQDEGVALHVEPAADQQVRDL